MNIEPPGIDDADALADAWVALAADQQSYDSLLVPEANRASAREAICRSIVTGGALVARVDDDLAGFVQFGLESGLYETAAPKGVVENLFVVASYRDAGVGSALLEAAEDALVADGAGVVVLDVMADNEGARRFYRRHGYDPHRITMLKRVENDLHDGEDR
ncbi:GNAT family N-acetyltransferase [Halomarina oriensis]|uniref:GNAT family N-acetyltransferase n=1 Tax=Halomarina oriensis TaxID=671145 RepID=A0A6B0GPX7_9EURY|nr:GNAT family N-acetyltransferase [Halomarina oriensis]